MPGQNLKQLLDRCVTLDPQQTTSILRQVTVALRKAEQHHIVHRDIKPENILLGTDGTVKVADFGLARHNSSHAQQALTQVGITMGTPLYMSPEQVEGRPLDSRSDIYSLGVTTYQMLTGRPPFEGDTALSLALAHVRKSPQPLHELRDDIPQALCDIIHRMLAKKPDDRFANAAELMDCLEALPIAGGRPAESTDSLSGAVVAFDESALATCSETQALQLALKSHRSRSRWSFRRVWPFLLAALLGAGLAWTLRGGDPLAQDTAEQGVPRRESASAQYIYAVMNNSEQAWKSVEEYFPLDAETNETQRLQVLRSRHQLARWYLTNDQPEQAVAVLEKSLIDDDMYDDLHARGLAWLAIAYQRMGESDKAADVLSSALSLAEFLDQPILDELDNVQRELEQSLP